MQTHEQNTTIDVKLLLYREERELKRARQFADKNSNRTNKNETCPRTKGDTTCRNKKSKENTRFASFTCHIPAKCPGGLLIGDVFLIFVSV